MDDLAGLRQGTVAALLSREIDNHRAGFHALDHALRYQFWCRFAGDQSGRDYDIDLHRLCGKQGHFGLEKRVGHYLCVTAFAFALFLDIYFEKLGSHARDLIFTSRTRVKSAYYCPQRSGRTDGRESGDTGSDDHDLCRINASGGGDLAAEESREIVRRLDNRPITGDVCHRRKRVHFLSTRDSRDAVHAENGRFPFCEQIKNFAILGRPDKSDEPTAFL